MIQLASNADTAPNGRAASNEVSQLKRVATAFETAQASRVRSANQIRSIVQGRGETRGVGWRVDEAEQLLARIRAGVANGPVEALDATYRRHWEEERRLLGLLTEQVAQHPVWPWLERVRGVGPSLAARLLARLDVERAPTPSSFWAYCGLATVPAERLRCSSCGYELAVPAGREPRPSHRAARTGAHCAGPLVPVDGAPSRVAQPRPARGEAAPYDAEAKRICYLIGTSIVRQGGAYKRYYHEQRQRLEGAKAGWIARRQHLTALRMTEKLFLSHLWLVWRERRGLPVTPSYADTHADAAPPPGPWAMVDA